MPSYLRLLLRKGTKCAIFVRRHVRGPHPYLLSQNFSFFTKSGYANPVPMESLLDKDASDPSCFQIHSVVWLKIHAKLIDYTDLQSRAITQQHEIVSRNTKDTKLSYSENLSLYLNWS